MPPTKEALFPLQRLLCPMICDASSRAALEVAVGLACHDGAGLLALSVVSPDAVLPDPDSVTGYSLPDAAILREERRLDLETLLHEVVPYEVRTFPMVCLGDVIEKILHVAETVKPSAIVIGTHGRAGFSHHAFGSVAWDVLRDAPCPVFAVGPGFQKREGSGATVRRILCPLDWSEPSLLALDRALEASRHFRAELVLLNVVAPLEFQQHSYSRFDRLKLHKPALNGTKYRVEEGEAAAEICQMAREDGSDLLVMATHGESGWRPWMFGSVAERVLHDAPCPVLLVRSKEE